MTLPSPIAISSSHGDRLIRVLVANQKSKGFNPTTFPETEVERVMGIGEDRSALVLRSGAEIPVALSYEQLEQKIYERDFRTDGPVLDLRDVTGEVAQPNAANQALAEPKIGDLDGGGVYVGKSATTGKDLHAALADEKKYLTFDEAFEAAAEMRRQPGRENAHVPTLEELNENLYKNKDKGRLSGTFNTSGSYPASCYRSSAPTDFIYARVQWFVDGGQGFNYKVTRLPVRLVW